MPALRLDPQLLRTRRFWLALVSLGVAALITAYMTTAVVIATMPLLGDHDPTGRTPAAVGLDYEDITFHPRGDDTISLEGWLITADQPKATVVYVHGLHSSRDWRLELLRDLVDDGYTVFAIDMRGHGDSDPAPAEAGVMQAGIHEKTDVEGAVDYIRSLGAGVAHPLFLLGISYGATTSLLAAEGSDEVQGVFVDSAYVHPMDVIVSEISRQTPFPFRLAEALAPGISLASRVMNGIDYGDVAPAAVAGRLSYPLGFIHCDRDGLAPLNRFEEFQAQAPAGSTFTFIPGCRHAMTYHTAPEAYIDAALSYFNSRL